MANTPVKVNSSKLTSDERPNVACRLPPSAPMHGHDLLPVIRGEQAKVRDYACLGMDVEEFAIRTHLWHLIVPVDPASPPATISFANIWPSFRTPRLPVP